MNINERCSTRPEGHFAFGRNWTSYSEGIGEAKIAEAEADLRRLLGGGDLRGRRFIDVGCGSGIHSLAALRLGAAEVLAIDLDPDSVATTETVLQRYARGAQYRVAKASVFDLDPGVWGRFHVVYSWGVLHHTGDLEGALRRAAALVAPDGLFIVALYRKTWMCGFWQREKRWYAHASPRAQAIARAVYLRLFALRLRLRGRRLRDHVAGYAGNRGMDFYHDVQDWLGGYPYESISPERFEATVTDMGFNVIRSFIGRGRVLTRYTGLFGTGCDEYVCTRRGVPTVGDPSCVA